MFDANDHSHMSRALQLAARGLYTTQPNPRVGCVLARDGRVIGEGWHQYAGGPHAELIALNNAAANAVGGAENATVYLTLEPCSHHGKTPPCVDELIRHKIARVVIAMQDPNPQVNGNGIQQLQQAGIRVETGLMETQAAALNPGFIKRMRDNRPFVRLKQAMSLDGRTALANGTSQWISGESARIDVQHLRARSSAIMTGINTVLKDDPLLTVRLESLTMPGKLGTDIGTGMLHPLRVILDSHLRISPNARILQLPGDVLIVTTSDDKNRQRKLASEYIEVVRLPADASGRPNLPDLMSVLAAGQVNELLVECGAVLAGALLSSRLIDEIVLYVAPCILGDKAKGLFDMSELTDMQAKISLNIMETRPIGEDIRITARPLFGD